MRTKFAGSIFLLLIVAFNLRLGIASMSPVLENIRSDLDMTNFEVSFLTAIPVFCMGFFALFTTKLSNRFGAEKTIALCLGLIGVATTYRFFSGSPLSLFCTALLIGVGIAICGPLLSGFIKKSFPNKIGIMIGVYSVGMGLGASVSAGLTAPFEAIFNGSWNVAIASWGIFAFIALICWVPFMKKDKEDIEAKEIKLPINKMKAWIITLIFGLQSGAFYCISTWLAPFAQATGFTQAQAGTLITFFTIIQMSFSFIIPALVDRIGTVKGWLIVSSACTFIGLLLFILSTGGPWIATIFIAIGLGGVFPLALALPLYATETGEESSAWTAMMQGFGYILGGIIPVLAGYLRDVTNSDLPIFSVLALFCIVLMILVGTLRETR
ncbi:MFS transporter [Ureibacillus massiliensis 4400831 = CIP 108448 = CCUG 49529]|uniref:MFS transporter n=1 Tax=Ureibacillus massiliensis 4400831 = CIP 108448 = CCUG 49529 TaxID=1211035 RepID=A0A0A3J1V1_9BACL|nr:MFS transporter [Ureibacillus massiliensis]KGR89685.1 MFS transporter [Ureibacillus massiliensis 4400831 = CIP 108448 = CCUG 49529]